MNTQNKKLISGSVLSLLALALFANAAPRALSAETSEATVQTQLVQSAADPGTFTLRVVNKSNQDMVLFVDTNCANGPDYQQGVNAGQTRDLTYTTRSSGSCFFERSAVRIGIKDLTPTRMHWQSGMVPAGWSRGELDGQLPAGMEFGTSAGGDSTLTYAPN